MIEKNQQNQTGSLKRLIKMINLARLPTKKREKKRSIIMKKGLSLDTTNTKGMIGKYYKQFNAHTLNNLDEMELKTTDYQNG